jgi:hypothetical protein
MVGERRTRSPRSRTRQERLGEIESIDLKSRFGEQMAMPSLSTWHVQDARAGRQSQNVDQSRNFTPIALEREQWLILAQVFVVEVPRPPLTFRNAQKKTGSR